jgi:hypothetical protein
VIAILIACAMGAVTYYYHSHEEDEESDTGGGVALTLRNMQPR